MTITLYLGSGLVALYFGADWLVRGSARLALRLGLTPLLVGLTIVAYGTSTPELLVSVVAAFKGQGSIAVGNAVGSNIFNVGLILGLTALLTPLRVQHQLIRFDGPFMVAVAGGFLLVFLDGQISQLEGAALLAGIVVYTIANIRLARRETSREVEAEFASAVPKPTGTLGRDLALILLGLIVLVAGSRLFVVGAVDLARLWGVSEAVIGLTIVAAGTSLPELASSLMAAFRKQADIAIGNIIGSNIYNILAILGVAGVSAGPLDGVGIRRLDVVVMMGISALLLPILWSRRSIDRWEGGLLVCIYGTYVFYVWPK